MFSPPHILCCGGREGDSPPERRGFELVWGFSCQVVVLVCCRFFVRSGKAVLRTRRLRSGSRRDDDLRQGLPQLRRLTVPGCGGSEGSSPLGADLSPHTSHEGRTVKGSIVKGATVRGRGRRVADAGPLHIQIV